MRESFSFLNHLLTRDDGSFASDTQSGVQPVLKEIQFSARVDEQHDLMNAADREAGGSSSFVSTYDIAPGEEGGVILVRTDPFGGDKAGLQSPGYVPCPPPVTDINASLGLSQAARPPHRGRTTNT